MYQTAPELRSNLSPARFGHRIMHYGGRIPVRIYVQVAWRQQGRRGLYSARSENDFTHGYLERQGRLVVDRAMELVFDSAGARACL